MWNNNEAISLVTYYGIEHVDITYEHITYKKRFEYISWYIYMLYINASYIIISIIICIFIYLYTIIIIINDFFSMSTQEYKCVVIKKIIHSKCKQ